MSTGFVIACAVIALLFMGYAIIRVSSKERPRPVITDGTELAEIDRIIDVEPSWKPEYHLLSLYNSLCGKGLEPSQHLKYAMAEIQQDYDESYTRKSRRSR